MALTEPVLAWSATWALSCLVAVVRGPSAPRLLACAMLLQLLVVLTFQPHEDHYRTSLSLALTDGALLILCAALARRTGATWAAVATGLQGAAVSCHLAKLLDSSILSWAYVTLQAFWSFGVLICLVWASLRSKVPVHASEKRDG